MERHIVEDLSTAITLVLLIQCRLSNDVFKSNINFHWSPNHPRTIGSSYSWYGQIGTMSLMIPFVRSLSKLSEIIKLLNLNTEFSYGS